MADSANKISLRIKKQKLGKLEIANTKLARGNRQIAYWQTLERKQDTRLKLQLGEMIKKVGMAHEDPEVILGLLLEAVNKLSNDESEITRDQWRQLGKASLSTDAPSSLTTPTGEEHART